jgi:hypothetical protein
MVTARRTWARNAGLAAVVAALGGCLGSAPSLLSSDDGGQDATSSGQEGGASVDGTMGDAAPDQSVDGGAESSPPGDGGGDAPVEAATCTGAGVACDAGTCQVGKVECDGGAAFCASLGAASDGTGCSDGGVCSSGQCVGCMAGLDCSEAGSCQAMQIDCASGVMCVPNGNKANGTSCGTNLYCNAGACAPCTNGAPCTPSDNACHQGTASCSAGQVVCTDTMANAAAGTTCGLNEVCNAGQCVACTAGLQCHPNNNPCINGSTSCATGQSTCVATANVTNGTPCSDGNLCMLNEQCTNGTCQGTAVTCTAMDQCHSVGTCNPATGACSNPALNGTTCNDNNPCTTGDQCNSGVCQGTAVTCTATDQCHGVGTCDMSTGLCSNPALTGTSCNNNACLTGQTCSSGTCTGGSPIACPAPDQCHTAGSCSGGTCGGYTALTGNSCGSGANMTCQNGTCGCAGGLSLCPSGCADETTDDNNCGTCSKVCPALVAPGMGANCQPPGVCEGQIGSASGVGGSFTLAVGVIYAVQAVVPAGQTATVTGFDYVFNTLAGDSVNGFQTFITIGVYADNGGVPGALVGPSASTTLAQITGQTPGTLSASGTLNAGTYWIGVTGNWSSGTMPVESSNTCAARTWSNGGTLPTPWTEICSTCSTTCGPVALAAFVNF